MKVIYLIIVVLILLPAISTAQNIEPGKIPTGEQMGIQSVGGAPTNITGIVGVLATLVKWTYTIFFIAAAFFILMAAFKYLTGGANPANAQVAHKMIMYAAIAIAVAFMSVGFEVIIKNFIAPNSGGNSNTDTGSNYQYRYTQPRTGVGNEVGPGGPTQ